MTSGSQPFAVLPSQLRKPALQATNVHEPESQLSVAFARSHARPHAPQLVSDVSAVSQPFASFESQFP